MQAFIEWSPPVGTLGQLVAEARQRAEALASDSHALEMRALAAPPVTPFAAALRRADVGIIAEVKRRSPSKGAIAPIASTAAQARAYAQGGAAALSILTEPRHFGGDTPDLVDARGAVALPLLKKDFHVHSVQLVEARACGASAVLLIARALSPDALATLAAEGIALGLELLVEIRDERELERALRTDAGVIGVNNRDLETLLVDPSTSERLVPMIPPDRVAVAESGYADVGGIRIAAGAGADAVLVGSRVSASDDPANAVRALTGVTRRGRGAR